MNTSRKNTKEATAATALQLIFGKGGTWGNLSKRRPPQTGNLPQPGITSILTITATETAEDISIHFEDAHSRTLMYICAHTHTPLHTCTHMHHMHTFISNEVTQRTQHADINTLQILSEKIFAKMFSAMPGCHGLNRQIYDRNRFDLWLPRARK